MRKYKYEIIFKTGHIEILWASSKDTAKILARAKEIENGNDYTIISAKKID